MRKNVTQATADALQEMVDESFIMTARLDRMQSALDADLAYNNTGKMIHNIAHLYSGFFGDEIADLGLQGYDISVNYGNVPSMKKDYNSVSELLYEARDYIFDYQNKLNMCYKIAFDNMDIHVCSDIMDVIEEHNVIVRQIILMCNKIDLYGTNPSYDAHLFMHFNLLGEVD